MPYSFNPDEIIAKLKKPPKMAVVCFVFAGICLLGTVIGLVAMLLGADMGVIGLITGIPFGLMFLVIALIKILKSKKALKNVNFDVIRSELMNGVMTYNNTVFFTQNYVLSNYYTSFVISYMDIVWMYQIDKYANGVYCGADLALCLVTGKKETLPFSNQFVDVIREHNPVVLIGSTSEYKKVYKRKVEEYKRYSATTNGMTYQQLNNQMPQYYKPMSEEDPIYQFNKISKEMREAANNFSQQEVKETPAANPNDAPLTTPNVTAAPAQNAPVAPAEQQVVQQQVEPNTSNTQNI